MNLTVNGEKQELMEPGTLGQLLDRLGIVPERVAVMINGRVIPKTGRNDVSLREGDRLEILTFMGGG